VTPTWKKAIEYLRKKGIAQAAKKATRIASEGIIANYMHGSRIGVMLEVNCETDFVSRNPDFQTFAREVSMQVAAMRTPSSLSGWRQWQQDCRSIRSWLPFRVGSVAGRASLDSSQTTCGVA